jgi:hypothetical protein
MMAWILQDEIQYCTLNNTVFLLAACWYIGNFSSANSYIISIHVPLWFQFCYLPRWNFISVRTPVFLFFQRWNAERVLLAQGIESWINNLHLVLPDNLNLIFLAISMRPITAWSLCRWEFGRNRIKANQVRHSTASPGRHHHMTPQLTDAMNIFCHLQPRWNLRLSTDGKDSTWLSSFARCVRHILIPRSWSHFSIHHKFRTQSSPMLQNYNSAHSSESCCSMDLATWPPWSS